MSSRVMFFHLTPILIGTGIVTIVSLSASASIDEIIGEAVSENRLYGAVLVVRNGSIVHRAGYGLADRELGIANTPETQFGIGSLTKSFTAALVLQCVQEGKIGFEAPVSDYLPWYRMDTGERVRIVHLLGHTSGVPNYLENADYLRSGSQHPYRPQSFVEKYCSGNLKFVPGTEFEYSPSGYMILGEILATVTGQTLADLLDERICRPLGLAHTGVEPAIGGAGSVAKGYDAPRSGFRDARALDFSTAGASGAIFSTVDDLHSWINALEGERIVHEELFVRMVTPGLGGYGLGWFAANHEVGGQSVPIYYHGGRINGFNVGILRVPGDDHLVIVLNNVTQYSGLRLAFELLPALYQ